jgi:Cysteine rich repeat
MRVGSYESLFMIVAMSSFLAFGSSTHAQTAVAQKVETRLAAASAKLQAACGGDLSKYCSTVTPGEGRIIFCMMAHEDKLSEKCDYALYDASRKMERTLDLIEQAADACWNDIEKHCAKIPEGGGRIAQCLLNNKASVARACRVAIEKFPAAK